MTFVHRTILGATLYLLFCNDSHSQSPSFYHLTTANGLYDNHVRSLAIDKQGFLWIGTEEGVNVYDGNSTSFFLKEKFPALPSDLVTQLYCDSRNRIWIGTPEGAAWIDDKRNIHRISLDDTLSRFTVKAIIETKQGIILVTDKGHYVFKEKRQNGQQLKTASRLLPASKIKTAATDDENKMLFVADSSIISYDYAAEKATTLYTSAGLLSVCKLKGDEIAIGKENGEVLVLNTVNRKIIKQYSLQEIVKAVNRIYPTEIKQAVNGDLVVVTGFNGLITISTAGKVLHFLHDPINSVSLVSNNVYRIATGDHGQVIIGTSTSGVSMYNVYTRQAGFTGFFTDASGNYYDNYTGRMLEGDEGNVWIAAYDRLIKWNRNTNSSIFYFYTDAKDEITRGDIRAMCKGRNGQLWISIDKKGIASFSEKAGFTKLKFDTTSSPLFSATTIPEMISDEEGLIWVCTNKGVFTFNPSSAKPGNLTHPIIKALMGKVVQSAFIDSRKRMWFATLNDGVFCFEKNGPQVFHYTTKEGLPSNISYAVQEDQKGRLFIPTSKGLAMLTTDGKLQTFTKQSGLRYDRCESVLIDNNNIIWFSNKKCLIRLNADTKELQFFDETSFLLNDGFRVASCLKTRSGELFWGGYRGISYFFPQQLQTVNLPLQVNIHRLQVQDSLFDIASTNNIQVPYTGNRLTISFAGVHLGIPGKTYYQYRLIGFDKDWQKTEDIQTARYTLLPPGDYVFEVKASIDGSHWTEAEKKLNIEIIPPLWMRWWFIALAASFFAGIIYWLVQSRNKKLREQKEELEAEQAINYFASSIHEQQSVDAILWDVVRNCIGRLHFEDCVIYLVDDQRNVLVQKAAHGPKSPKNFQINEPIEIPVGQGIVGVVALSGKAELIGDTSKDSRYIVDDKRRYSEISVPLIRGGKVIGVIDCEHRQKNYFTKKHLSILITIASLCANKIIRAKAEEEKKKAQLILTDTQQKMAEAEMQALRAQMNPHFIFNCLNSINRYILKSDEATASLYLTRFAKLIRLILDNSSSKKVSLSNELEALKLYIEMEALRFDKKFLHNITIDKLVNTDSIELPSLIIQPYVENAIWHGLLHKEGEGRLSITIRMADEGMLECIIDDTGIGRTKAKLLKSKSATHRKSLGMQLTEKRLALLNQQAELNASVTIIDKEDEQKKSTGTKVILQIPV